ncbi:hypothetical protein B0T18DRAFT_489560 [Schizothecium vesticola]|uniref:Uncharacterized protein n=1 Tax=Schizothecium vesticola TaxID=314040 RepID=A0AA40ENH1_9PEZI|nr:hypothetical protein B0T18DRAFT_489560 [Schizothecium vesticola]
MTVSSSAPPAARAAETRLSSIPSTTLRKISKPSSVNLILVFREVTYPKPSTRWNDTSTYCQRRKVIRSPTNAGSPPPLPDLALRARPSEQGGTQGAALNRPRKPLPPARTPGTITPLAGGDTERARTLGTTTPAAREGAQQTTSKEKDRTVSCCNCNGKKKQDPLPRPNKAPRFDLLIATIEAQAPLRLRSAVYHPADIIKRMQDQLASNPSTAALEGEAAACLTLLGNAFLGTQGTTHLRSLYREELQRLVAYVELVRVWEYFNVRKTQAEELALLQKSPKFQAFLDTKKLRGRHGITQQAQLTSFIAQQLQLTNKQFTLTVSRYRPLTTLTKLLGDRILGFLPIWELVDGDISPSTLPRVQEIVPNGASGTDDQGEDAGGTDGQGEDAGGTDGQGEDS